MLFLQITYETLNQFSTWPKYNYTPYGFSVQGRKIKLEMRKDNHSFPATTFVWGGKFREVGKLFLDIKNENGEP